MSDGPGPWVLMPQAPPVPTADRLYMARPVSPY
jgi:hypothetical protein